MNEIKKKVTFTLALCVIKPLRKYLRHILHTLKMTQHHINIVCPIWQRRVSFMWISTKIKRISSTRLSH